MRDKPPRMQYTHVGPPVTPSAMTSRQRPRTKVDREPQNPARQQLSVPRTLPRVISTFIRVDLSNLELSRNFVRNLF